MIATGNFKNTIFLTAPVANKGIYNRESPFKAVLQGTNFGATTYLRKYHLTQTDQTVHGNPPTERHVLGLNMPHNPRGGTLQRPSFCELLRTPTLHGRENKFCMVTSVVGNVLRIYLN